MNVVGVVGLVGDTTFRRERNVLQRYYGNDMFRQSNYASYGHTGVDVRRTSEGRDSGFIQENVKGAPKLRNVKFH